MSVTDRGGQIERFTAGDGTMCLYCVECYIRLIYLGIVRIMYFWFMELTYLGTKAHVKYDVVGRYHKAFVDVLDS